MCLGFRSSQGIGYVAGRGATAQRIAPPSSVSLASTDSSQVDMLGSRYKHVNFRAKITWRAKLERLKEPLRHN